MIPIRQVLLRNNTTGNGGQSPWRRCHAYSSSGGGVLVEGICVAHHRELMCFLSFARFLSPSGQFGGLRGGGGVFPGWVNGAAGVIVGPVG